MTDLVRRESEFLLYTAPDGAVKVGVLFRDETAWLTQKALAELFAVKVPAINKHLKNIFESGELSEDSVVSILEATAADGKAYKTRFYNLDAILADKGKVNALEAKLKTEGEYEVYRRRQDAEFVSDFDRVVEETQRLEGSAGPKTIGAGSAKERGVTKPDKAPSKGGGSRDARERDRARVARARAPLGAARPFVAEPFLRADLLKTGGRG